MSASLPCSAVPPFCGGPPSPLQTSFLTRDARVWCAVSPGVTGNNDSSYSQPDRIKKNSTTKRLLSDFPLLFLFANYLPACLNCFRLALICASLQICSVDCPLSEDCGWKGSFLILLTKHLADSSCSQIAFGVVCSRSL